MLFPFLSLMDGTEIVYSEIIKMNDKEHVLVKFERWNNARDDFDSMECVLPDGEMTNIIGFTDEEAKKRHLNIIDLKNVIMDCSKEDTEKMQCQL